MRKLVAAVSSVLVSLGLAASFQPPPRRRPARSQGQTKGKGEPKKKGGPADDLRKAYDLLTPPPRRRQRHGPSRGADSRLDRARGQLLPRRREVVQCRRRFPCPRVRRHRPRPGPGRRPRPQRRAVRPPRLRPAASPDGFGPDDSSERIRRDLNRAYDRINEFGDRDPAPAAGFNRRRRATSTAPRDATCEAGREERAGELARAAEAMTHVAEHLGHAADGPPPGRGRLGLRTGQRREPPAPLDRPEPKGKTRPSARESDLPPPLPPGLSACRR